MKINRGYWIDLLMQKLPLRNHRHISNCNKHKKTNFNYARIKEFAVIFPSLLFYFSVRSKLAKQVTFWSTEKMSIDEN